MRKRIEKPWGYEEIIESNNDYLFKRIFIKEGHRIDAQYNEDKTETAYVVTGTLTIDLCEGGFEPHTVVLYPSNHFTIPISQKHIMIGHTDCVYLEVSSSSKNDGGKK